MAQRRIAIIISVQGAPGARNKLKGVNDEVQRGTHLQNGLTSSFIKGNLAARAISFGIVKLQRSIRFAYDSMVDFEFAMKKLTAIKLLDVKASKQLEDSIRAVAAVSPKTAIEVANTALSIAKLGLSADETSKSLKGIIDLSVVLDEDVNMVGKSMVAVKNTFGKSASEMDSIANKLFTGFANSALDLEKFTTAFSFSGAAAESAGVSFEQLTALMGVLSSRGIKASTIGTQLRSVFLDLSNPTSKASKAIGGMTIQIDGLEAVLRALNEAELQNFEIKDKFTKRSVNVVEILSKEVDLYKELNGEIVANKDNLEKSIDIIEETAKITRDKMISAFQDLSIAVGDFANPKLITFFETVALALNSINPDVGSMSFIEDSEKIKDVIGLIEKILDVQTKLDDNVSPFLSEYLQRLSPELIKYRNQIENITGLTMDKLVPANRNLVDVLVELKAVLTPLEDKYDGLIDLTSQFNEIISKGGAKEQIDGLEGLIVSANDFATALVDWGAKTEEIKEVDDFVFKLEGKVRDLEKAIKDVNQLKLEGLISDRDKISDKVLKLEKKILRIKKKESALINGDIEAYSKLKEKIEENVVAREKLFALNMTEEALSGVGSLISAFERLGQVQLNNELQRARAAGATEDQLDSIRRESLEKQKELARAAIAINLAQAITKAFADYGWPWGLVPAGLTTAAAGVQLSAVNSQQYASGFDGIVRQPTLMQVGEAGPERVQVTSSAKTARGKSGGDTYITVQGSLIDMDGLDRAVNRANQNISRRYVNV